jgi:GcrA cell cycle regulator
MARFASRTKRRGFLILTKEGKVLEGIKNTARVWSPERKAILADLWGKQTAAEIAALLGNGITKNAVIGQAHRLALVREEGDAWSAADDEILRTLWADCRSATYIATQISRRTKFGSFLAHKSIQSRAYNIGLRRRPPTQQVQPSNRQRRLPAPPPTHVIDRQIPLGQRKAFLELEPHHCRWPVGEPDEPGFFFCAATKLDDHWYCADHHRRSRNYTRPAARHFAFPDQRSRFAA